MINGIEKKNISVKELKKDGRYLNAALYTPKTEPGKTYPLVLFLHGAGERGDDLNLVLDFTPGADTFMTDAWQAEHPCFVLAPQCPENQCWVPYVDLLAQSLLEMAAQYPVDICRLYVTGVSMGGAGTWELLTRYPHKIAAAMPICGYAEPFKLRAAKDVPVWAFHAEDDPVVPVTGYYHSPHGAVGVGSRMAMSSLRSSGNRDAHYTEYPAGEMENVYHTHPHGSWTAAYQNKEALEWMFGKTRFDRYEIEFICPGVFYMEDYNNDSMYLVEGKEKALLIDTGLGGGNVRKMAESLTSLPVELAVTHGYRLRSGLSFCRHDLFSCLHRFHDIRSCRLHAAHYFDHDLNLVIVYNLLPAVCQHRGIFDFPGCFFQISHQDFLDLDLGTDLMLHFFFLHLQYFIYAESDGSKS